MGFVTFPGNFVSAQYWIAGYIQVYVMVKSQREIYKMECVHVNLCITITWNLILVTWSYFVIVTVRRIWFEVILSFAV